MARKILAMKIRAMGDTALLSAPVLELIRAFPQAEIHVAVTSAWAPIFERMPGVARVWKYERHRDRAARAKAATRMALRLRREKFDTVVCFHASPSTAMMSFATGAKTRAIHFHGHRSRNRYSTVVVPGKGVLKPIIERDMDAVRALGIAVPAGRLPRVFLDASEEAWARDWVNARATTQPVLGIGLGASRPTKGWPLERYAQVALRWCRETGGSAIVIDGPPLGSGSSPEDLRGRSITAFLKHLDDLLVAEIADPAERAAIRGRISAHDDLSIRQLCAVLGQLRVFAGNDSGPRHLAVAVGTPTVTLFGPEHPFEWHPYPVVRHPYLFVENLPCRRDAIPGMPPWCGLETCVIEEHRCLRNLGVEDVLAQCRRLIAGVP